MQLLSTKLLVSLIIVGALVSSLACKQASTVTPEINSIAAFIKNNPNRSSFVLIRNDSVKISLRPNQKFPLASTVKIIVAIEFAKQVANGKIKADELVPVSDLDLYYIPNTDGNAHPDWKANATTRKTLTNNKVSLQEVAKGMIWFSSNANTEYLIDRLGVENVNTNLKTLNLPTHDRVYYLVSALGLYANNANLANVAQLSTQDYETQCAQIHTKLKADGSYKKQLVFPAGLDWQKGFTNRLPAATTGEYSAVMQKVLSQSYFSKTEMEQLEAIMQPILALAPANKAVYQRFYAKGGSTSFALTYAMSAKTQDGKTTVMSVFFNDLTPAEQSKLSGLLNGFLINCTQGENYKTIAQELGN